MGFFSFVVLLGIAYLLWRVTDQLPDLIFRMSEIQRDVAEIRRSQSTEPAGSSESAGAGVSDDAEPTPTAADTSADDATES